MSIHDFLPKAKSEAQASECFDILKALFNESEETIEEISEKDIDDAAILSIERLSASEEFYETNKKLESSIIQESQTHEEHDAPQLLLKSNLQMYHSPIYLKHLEDEYTEILPKYNKCLEVTREKLSKLGFSTIDKTGKLISALITETILDKIIKARENLSSARRKLLSQFHKLEQLRIRNDLLDLQIKGIRLEELHDLQVEVSRTTEKIDETSKQVAKARTQYESDISKAAHIREKWFAFQNKIFTKADELEDLRRTIQEHREYLCDLLKRKKGLRKKNFQLKMECRIIDNKPLLRKYDRVVEEIEQLNYQKKRFAEL